MHKINTFFSASVYPTVPNANKPVNDINIWSEFSPSSNSSSLWLASSLCFSRICHWQSNVNKQNRRKRSIKQQQIDAADFYLNFIPLSDSWGTKLRLNIIMFIHLFLTILIWQFCLILVPFHFYPSPPFFSIITGSWHTGTISKPASQVFVTLFPSS